MAIKAAAVYSGWICSTAASAAMQTRAGSESSVMVGKKKPSLVSSIEPYTTTQDKKMTA